MRHLPSISYKLIIASLLLAQLAPAATEPQDASMIHKKEGAELTSIRGEDYHGMSKDDLFDLFKSRCQLLGSQKILNKEWVAFRDPNIKSSENVMTFEFKDGLVVGWEMGYVTDPANRGSEYEFAVHEKMDRWFFPPDRAWWDGTKVKLLDWHKLRRNQQIVFLTEYVEGINRKFNSRVTIDIDKYLIALDHYADSCNESCVRIPLAEAVNTILINEGKATEEK